MGLIAKPYRTLDSDKEAIRRCDAAIDSQENDYQQLNFGIMPLVANLKLTGNDSQQEDEMFQSIYLQKRMKGNGHGKILIKTTNKRMQVTIPEVKLRVGHSLHQK